MTSRRPPMDNGDHPRASRKSSVTRDGHRRSSSYARGPVGSGSGDHAGKVGHGDHHRHSGTAAASGGIDHASSPNGEETIRVALRLRPQNKLENSKRGKSCVEIHKGSTKITVDAPLEGEYDFSFDRVFGERAGQTDVYDGAVSSLAQKAMEGLDTALVAYGQTGSGKTYTMMGTGWGDGLGRKAGEGQNGEEKKDDAAAVPSFDPLLTDKDGKKLPLRMGNDAGMIPRIVRDLYKQMAESPNETEFTVRVSYVEVYMEKVLDLLNPTNRSLGIFHDSGGEDADGGSGTGGSGASGTADLPMGAGVRIKGAAELCCLHEADVLALLARGNAYRKLSSNDMSTCSNRSHSVFMIRLERKDGETQTSRTSRMLLVDLAGSEMADKKVGKSRPDQRKGNGAPSQKEAKMVNRSFIALANVIKALGDQQRTQQQDEGGGNTAGVPYQKAKLTRVLRHAFGGRCSTTMILTGSPSSFSISETLATIRFGQKCRRVRNRPQICLDLSPDEYRKQLSSLERRQTELMSFVKALAGECRSIKTEGLRGKLKETAHRGPIWDSIDTILEDSEKEEGGLASRLAAIGQQKSRKTLPSSASRHSVGTASAASAAEITSMREELEKAQEELAEAKKETFLANQARNKAESILGEIQSEAAALRTQNENLSAEKKKNMQDLIDAKNEIQVLSQRKLEVEHNLRVSQFRENEATVFLRQFRRFYRRLLRNKAAQGTGATSEITAKVPGVPDLNDLIDVDTLLLESGLIEEEELRDDAVVGTYRPSSQALLRSTSAAKKAAKEAAALEKAGNGPYGSAENLGSISEMSGGGGGEGMPIIGAAPSSEDEDNIDGSVSAQSILSRNVSGRMSAMNITAKQQNLQTPSGRLISMREKDLERDLLQMTERCIELQIALNEEKANVDVLTNRTGSLSKKRLAQEAISLRQALDRKTHDLQAIIWKMNELHLINKTYNEKMANREQHVTYLEENLVDLQNTNRRLISDRQEAETKLRSDLGEMKELVDSMTIPLWQFGEEGSSEHSLASRVIIPLHGGPYPDGVNWKASPVADGGGYASDGSDDGDGDSDDEGRQKNRPLHKKPPSADAATQTIEVPGTDKDLSTNVAVGAGVAAASVAAASAARDDKALNGSKSSIESKENASVKKREADAMSKATASLSKGGSSDKSSRSANGALHDVTKLAPSESVSPTHSKAEDVDGGKDELFVRGKPHDYQHRRFVHKLGVSIRNGVLREGKKKKSGDSGSTTSGSRSKSKSRSSTSRSVRSTRTKSTSKPSGRK